jgi:hypothetical protein
VRSGHELLAHLDPWEWDYWQASYRLDTFGQDWQVGSMVAAEIINSVQALAAGNADDLKPIPRDAFTPYFDPTEVEQRELDESVEGLESLQGL